MAAIPDFIFPHATGLLPPALARELRFAFALMRLAARKPDVHKLVVEVQHLLRPRGALCSPLILARVMLEVAKGETFRQTAIVHLIRNVLQPRSTASA
jgi:hypothetical protein